MGIFKKKTKTSNLGVIVTDSKLTPLRKGVTGVGLSWCGFIPLRNYIGEPDIFGNNLKVTKTNIVDGLSAAAVVIIGEGSEQTPLAVLSEILNIEFVNRVPNKEEIDEMGINPKDDVFGKLISSVKWIRGKG